MRAISIDVETTKFPFIHPWQSDAVLSKVGIAASDGKVKTWTFNHDEVIPRNQRTMIEEIQWEIDKSDVIIAHNLKFDIHWLWKLGLNLQGKKIWCSQVADYMLNGQRKIGYSLNAVAARYGLGEKIDEVKKYWDAGIDTLQIPEKLLDNYLKQDCELTLAVYNKQVEAVAKAQLDIVLNLNFKVLLILAGMEYRGFKFDVDLAKQVVNTMRVERDTLEEQIQQAAGFRFNVGSGMQLSAAIYGGDIKVPSTRTYMRMYKSGKVKVITTKSEKLVSVPGVGFTPAKGTEAARSGYYKTDKNTLDMLRATTPEQKEFLTLLKQFSKVKKVIDTMQSQKHEDKGLINMVAADGNIHPRYNQTVTATGRLSSSSPNGQNLPRGNTSPIKGCIIPSNDCIVNVDLAQIEFRIAAALSGDKVMIKEIRDNLDVHADNAIKFLGAVKPDHDDEDKADYKAYKALRTTAKIITFRALYGGSAYSFFKDPAIPDYPLEKWESIMKAYYAKYSGLAEWQNRNVEGVMKKGFLRNPSGRILGFTKAQQNDGTYGYRRQQILNYPVQSAASDLMYLAMVILMERVQEAGLTSVPILQVHDSLVFDAKEGEVDQLCKIAVKTFRELPELAKQIFGWDIPVPLDGDCEVGPNYKDIKTYHVEV